MSSGQTLSYVSGSQFYPKRGTGDRVTLRDVSIDTRERFGPGKHNSATRAYTDSPRGMYVNADDPIAQRHHLNSVRVGRRVTSLQIHGGGATFLTRLLAPVVQSAGGRPAGSGRQAVGAFRTRHHGIPGNSSKCAFVPVECRPSPVFEVIKDLLLMRGRTSLNC